MPQSTTNIQAICKQKPQSVYAQIEFEQHIKQQAQELAPEIQIDSDIDPDFGELFRVWTSYHFLGSFYQNLEGKWIVQPCGSDQRPNCDTKDQAILAIIAITGNLVADTQNSREIGSPSALARGGKSIRAV